MDIKLGLSSDLPEGVDRFVLQAAGHKHGEGRLGIGVLKHTNGDLLKPMFDGDRRSDIERSLYERVWQKGKSEPLLQVLKCFVPEFRGTWKSKLGDKEVQYLCLEDVSANFENPSVMDVKMGCKTYDDNASPSKILSQSTKYKYGETVGVRIQGMKVYDAVNKKYSTKMEKNYWKQLSPQTVVEGLKMYLCGKKHIDMLILCGYIHKLEHLRGWFSRQRLLKFVGSSLLFVYEGSQSAWEEWFEKNRIPLHCNCDKLLVEEKAGSKYNLCLPATDICDVCNLSESVCKSIIGSSLYRVAMIDFSHCFSYDEEDTNYIFGLQNLITYFKELLKSL